MTSTRQPLCCRCCLLNAAQGQHVQHTQPVKREGGRGGGKEEGSPPDVSLCAAVAASRKELRGCVSPGAKPVGLAEVGVLQHLGEPHVRDFGSSVQIQQNVAGLHAHAVWWTSLVFLGHPWHITERAGPSSHNSVNLQGIGDAQL